MAIKEPVARDIFAAILQVYPSNLEMRVYKTVDAIRADLGKNYPSDNPAAFYSAGTIYVMLDQFDDKGKAAFIITHEIGHQVFDPGSIFAGYIVWRLWMKKFEEKTSSPDETMMEKMIGAQNIYSDIVVNRAFWGNAKLRTMLGEAALNRAIMEWYGMNQSDPAFPHLIEEFIKKPDYHFKQNFLQANMWLGYISIFRPTDFETTMKNIKDHRLKRAINIINHLVKEQNLAVVNVQKYYEVMLPYYDDIYWLKKDGYQRTLTRD